MKLNRPIILILFFPLLITCEKETNVESNIYTYQKPRQLNDGWRVSSVTDQDMDTDLIEQVTSNIISKQFHGIHGLLIVKNGFLVHEAYFEGYNREDLNTVYSITKSITSALIGIAIEQKFIRSPEDKLLSFFPQYDIQEIQKQQIQLYHLLTLTSGFSWDEKSFSYANPQNSETQIVATNDWMKFVLTQPLQNDPGAEWVYNTGSVHLLSGVIKYASGIYADKFAEQTIFLPLGITNYDWNKDPQGFPCTGGTQQGLRLKLRDIAKFGYLFLNKGKWLDNQIISEKWIEESTRKYVDLEGNS